MEVKKILSYYSAFVNDTTFEFDVAKVADMYELTEDEVNSQLSNLQLNNDIRLSENNVVELVNIKPRSNKKFNELFAPVETMTWDNGMKLKLDV